MYNTQANRLPVPFDQVDQSTINHALPQGNDVWPQLNVPQSLGGPVVGQIISEFRALAQSRINKTPLHTFAYNLLAINRFDNRTFSDWCQRAVDFTEFLVVEQHNNPTVALGKAVSKIYFGFLAITAGEYPAVAQQLDPNTHQELLRAGEEFTYIMNDIKAFHMAGRQPQPPAGGYGGQPNMGYPQNPGYGGAGGGGYGGGTPMGSNYGVGYNARPNQLPPVGAAPRPAQAPSGYGAPTAPHQQPRQTTATPTPAAGRYMDEPENSPTPQSWSSDRGFSIPTQATTTVPDAPAPEPEYEGTPPANLDQVVMDPFVFVPRGMSIDQERPYDHFYNPGGVEIVPAHLSEWERTVGSDNPYPQGYDPEEYVLFHVRWPDGVVQEKIVKWDIDMDYLKHEIDDRLRGLKIKPEGKVIASKHKITDYDDLGIDQETLEEKITGPLDVSSELNPVAVNTLFSASSDLENEMLAQAQLIEDLGLPKDTDKLPAYEYTSGCLYPIDLPKEVEDKLFAVTESKGLVGVAKRLQNLLNSGDLPVRYYRFFNDRLTKGLNVVLADNLAMPGVDVDSFVDDVEELYDLFSHNSKYDSGLTTVLDSQTSAFLKRWFNLAYEEVEGEDGRGQFSLFEEVVNLQTRWTTEEISSLNLTPNTPVLISQSTHAKLYQVVQTMIKRHLENGNLPGCRLRLVSVDGHYYELIRGWLVENSILLKDLG
jgi:hypothetical protein